MYIGIVAYLREVSYKSQAISCPSTGLFGLGSLRVAVASSMMIAGVWTRDASLEKASFLNRKRGFRSYENDTLSSICIVDSIFVCLCPGFGMKQHLLLVKSLSQPCEAGIDRVALSLGGPFDFFYSFGIPVHKDGSIRCLSRRAWPFREQDQLD
jgi:hypothetical protein